MAKLVRLAVVDPERCVGCQCCMFACARRHEPGLAESCIGIKSLGGMEKGFTVIVCRACEDPPCARVCPVDALRLRKGGGVLLDAAKCIGCGHCREACVLGAVYWDDQINKPMICVHCGTCAKYCPHGVLELEEREAGTVPIFAPAKMGLSPSAPTTATARIPTQAKTGLSPSDPLSNVLYVDLTKKSFRVERRADLFAENLGGAGAAIRLLDEECPAGCDPLGPENPIVLAVGPLTGLFPLASKAVAMYKSPHTGNLGESHCGGRTAVALRMAGFGAMVINGASTLPVYVAIHNGSVQFRDASTLWGMGSSFTVGRVIRNNEPAAGLRTIMRIGRAGEQLVSYASVTSETYRHFGRLGLGAVFGAKKLKAVVISGKRTLPVADMKQYRKVYDEVHRAAVDSPVMKKYHDLGTAENIAPLNQLGGLPTRNLKQARFEAAEAISGEGMAEHYLGRRLACSHCPVACIHVAALREPHPAEPYFYKTSMIGYDYEPIYAIGSMLGIGEPPAMLKLMDRIEALGLDVMTAGVVLAWATEALEQGLITAAETDGVSLAWGDGAAYAAAVERIVRQPNEFYRALARGVDFAAARYGGQDFALAFGGNEMPGYHTGPGAHLGHLIGARHSHLDNAGYSVDQKVFVKQPIPPAELVESLLAEERWRQILSSLVVCFFARGVYQPELVARALQVAGVDLSADDLPRIGKAIHAEKYRFKFREGFSVDDLRLPRRIFETPALAGGWDEPYVREALGCFRQAMA